MSRNARPDSTLRVGLFGRGRLASAVVDAASPVAWQVGRGDTPPPVDACDVVIDASIGEAVSEHLAWAIEHRVPLVIAATGWTDDALAERVGESTGVLSAPNGSLTVALMARLARLLGGYARTIDGAGGFVLDHHHAAKRDAPSGTALRLAEAFAEGSGDAPSVAAIRAGHEVGRHVVGLDAPGEVIELHHRARSRATFAHGLLAAARWLVGRRGVFTMDDVAAAVLDPLFY
ncbi:MAG: dihydrodipicolinate reductase C-terminal domain-containing protein [Acidobacteriota bacterium]